MTVVEVPTGGPDHAARARFEVKGVVQGVGFRPFVHRLAIETGLEGFVGNDSTNVFIEVRGPPSHLDEFALRLRADAPPLARVDTVTRTRPTAPPATIANGFRIVESVEAAGDRTLIPPDTAVCDDCVGELRDPNDRRYRHPFITCTNCGPRFTIIRDLPYDRPATTMADFEMCPACRAEYTDPTDRRYHAQPIACPDCGPTLGFVDGESARGRRQSDSDPILATVVALGAGQIVAIKGLGGYHLACDATDDEAVSRLRDHKHRPDKPFAVMVADIDIARHLAVVGDAEAAQLVSPARPIVLLRARHLPSTGGSAVSPFVAPGNPMIGLMLPSTPIHHLLFDRGAPPLVMTSGNVGGEPLVYRDDTATARLAPLCDAFLTHDRAIHVPCDDSIVRVAGDVLIPIRRARGFAPLPVPIADGTGNVLAVGGELKNAFCVASPAHAWMSQHIGDMENLRTLDAFERGVAQFQQIYGLEPDTVAVDMHPGYHTSRWARAGRWPRAGCDDRVLEVQHHHAHVAAVMAEHECDPHVPVLGFVFDGTGFGDDGTIWGGEVLLADVDGYERLAHLDPIDLPGGDAAVRHPCRVALAHLAAAGIDWYDDLPPVGALPRHEVEVLRRQLERGLACVPTTSMGRLFDAVASMLGLQQHITYEAHAAIQLEHSAGRARRRAGETTPAYAFSLTDGLIEQAPLLRRIVDDIRSGVAAERIAAAFHDAVADVVVTIAQRTRDRYDRNVVALSGGVFQNALLTATCVTGLRRAGFVPLTHHLVPPNDGGLALGQAFVATHRSRTGLRGGS